MITKQQNSFQRHQSICNALVRHNGMMVAVARKKSHSQQNETPGGHMTPDRNIKRVPLHNFQGDHGHTVGHDLSTIRMPDKFQVFVPRPSGVAEPTGSESGFFIGAVTRSR